MKEGANVAGLVGEMLANDLGKDKRMEELLRLTEE